MYKRENDWYKIPSFVAFINTIIILLNHNPFQSTPHFYWAALEGPHSWAYFLMWAFPLLSPSLPHTDISLFNSAYKTPSVSTFHPPNGKQNKIRSPITQTDAKLALIRPSFSTITDRGGVGDGGKRSSRVHKSY